MHRTGPVTISRADYDEINKYLADWNARNGISYDQLDRVILMLRAADCPLMKETFLKAARKFYALWEQGGYPDDFCMTVLEGKENYVLSLKGLYLARPSA